MPKDNSMGYSNMENSMKMHQSDLQAPNAVFSQVAENATLETVERDNKTRSKEAKKLRSQEYMGRY